MVLSFNCFQKEYWCCSIFSVCLCFLQDGPFRISATNMLRGNIPGTHILTWNKRQHAHNYHQNLERSFSSLNVARMLRRVKWFGPHYIFSNLNPVRQPGMWSSFDSFYENIWFDQFDLWVVHYSGFYSSMVWSVS